MNRYYLDYGIYPTTDEGLAALLPSADPADELDPGMILGAPPPSSGQLLDPWGHPFEYKSDGNYYFLESLGSSDVQSSDLTISSPP